jgi:FdhD protein
MNVSDSALSLSQHATSKTIDVEKCSEGSSVVCRDLVAEEIPVALVYNGVSHAVMMASPADLEDFALGFSLSEGILQHRNQLYECEVVERADGIALELKIATECFVRLKEQRRNLTGRTGCGLCGAETLQQAIRHPAPVGRGLDFTVAALYAGFDAMAELQVLQHATGATHGAAWLNADGEVTLVREDVGRHNAFDKLIGALTARGDNAAHGVALITSRASYEMVQKAATVGITSLAAISAPTALAIRLAQQTSVTLVGFVRQRSHVVYANGHRLMALENNVLNSIKE